MEQVFYKRFIKNISEYIQILGGDKIKETKYVIVIEFSSEKIILPKFNMGFIQIMCVKDGEIKEIFRTSDEYIRNAEKKFKKFLRARVYKTLNEYDGI